MDSKLVKCGPGHLKLKICFSLSLTGTVGNGFALIRISNGGVSNSQLQLNIYFSSLGQQEELPTGPHLPKRKVKDRYRQPVSNTIRVPNYSREPVPVPTKPTAKDIYVSHTVE